MKMQEVLFIEKTSGRSRRVTLRVTPGFWGKLFGLKAHDVVYYGNSKVWFKGSLKGPCTNKETTALISHLVVAFEASDRPT